MLRERDHSASVLAFTSNEFDAKLPELPVPPD